MGTEMKLYQWTLTLEGWYKSSLEDARVWPGLRFTGLSRGGREGEDMSDISP